MADDVRLRGGGADGGSTTLVRRQRAVSLGVEDGNRARALYERAGSVVVGREGGSDTMLLALS